MDSGIMQHTRRRKKRPNYGTRTVEVYRGKNGFGFTISGQQPCILSSIVPNSPADRVDLRPGDYLIAVCGQNVSKALHDDVVQLIGNCHGLLKLQIAENYYSDSSEEDLVMTIRQKPKYPYKYKHSGHNTHPFIQNKPPKYNISLDNCYYDDKCEIVKSNNENVNSLESAECASSKYNNVENGNTNSVENNCILQCIVGYLGTIEMPKKLTPVSRNQIVRSCIKRLRAEKRNYTAVMMTVFPCSLRLKNDIGTTIAVYPGGRVTFCSANNEQNRKYFGIVTTSVSEEPSNSCHVFVALSVLHQEHVKLASKFGITCSTANSEECNFFPSTCDAIVNAIKKFYDDQRSNDTEEPLVANSPQPSNDSSVITSNSDSGIGFRDDSGHQSDRILLVDIQNQMLHIQAAGLPAPQYIDCCAEKSDRSSSNTNQSLPTLDEKHQSKFLKGNVSCENIYKWNSKSVCKGNVLSNRLSWKSFDDLATPINNYVVNGSLERRLSPKVFGSTIDVIPVSQSLENLKTQSELYEDLKPSNSFLKQHSLQDLTAYSADTMNENEKCTLIEPGPKVTSWAYSLEKLLSDVVGLHAFVKFLKKEFSAENIYFWVACEKYRLTTSLEERQKLAQSIYSRYLANSASEPVNVDSSGKSLTLQQLETADVNLLKNAQKQIFNLMKYDSYTRFLKSDMFKNYLIRETAGECINLPTNSLDADLLIHSPQKMKNIKEDSEEPERNHWISRRRRSLLRWSRSRGKSKDRTFSNENISSSVAGSHTSLASWDLAVPVSLCRVILPDSSWTVLNIQPKETVDNLITNKLLEKRSMPYTNFQVIMTETDQIVDLNEKAAILSGKEVRIEWRIEFRLDLPDRKSLTIKSKPSHTLGAVLGPILSKHGYNLQMVTLCLMSENEVIEANTLVGAVDKQRIQVLTRSTPTPNVQGWNYYGCNIKQKQQTSVTLDEITNRVFEELLNGKAENYRNPVSENVPTGYSDDWSSEHSSKILGKFIRKESVHQDKYRRSKKNADEPSSTEKSKITNKLPPVIAKWKPGSKSDARLEKDGLLEGLRRCQRGRLEDQRGTEINIELPDFLKDKENTPSSRKKMKKNRKDANNVSKIVETEIRENENIRDTASMDGGGTIDLYQTPNFKNANPNLEEEYDNIYANDVLNFGCNSSTKSPTVFKEPPPLPPKPKNISWKFSKLSNYESSTNLDSGQTSIYLDRPTSSFV